MVEPPVSDEEIKDLIEVGTRTGVFNEALGLRELPDEERDAYQTLAGFILFRLDRVPQPGERFRWSEHECEVI